MAHRWYRSLVGFVLLVSLAAGLRAADHAESMHRLSESVKYLASDELEGRGVGTEGLNKAADYLAQQFAALGLKVDSFNGTPFQSFEINTSSELGPKEQNRLTLAGPPVAGGSEPRIWALELGKDFNPLAAGGSHAFDAPLVFAGYGITAQDLDYDDYAAIDAKGKVAIIIRKEPEQTNENSKFNGKQPSPHALFNRKIANANEHGVAAIIFVNDGLELSSRAQADQKTLQSLIEKLAQTQTEYSQQAEPSPEAIAKYRQEVVQLSQQIQELGERLGLDTDKLLEFQGAGAESSHRKLPVLFCSREKIDIVLKAALGKDLATLEAEIDSDLKPRSAELSGWTARGETSIVHKRAEVKNVVAVLEGAGPHADETVIVGAHYDHLGFGGYGSLAPWTSEIHNGADDNASGTAALLEIARRLATADHKPARRIVFIAFTGEERGLLGSAHYVREPKFPLSKTVAMINLDMVGRLQDNKLIIYGTGTAKEFDPLLDDLNKRYEFKITRKPGGFGPSDHASFYAKQIPVLHLFTGTHADYHRPSDDADKLNIDGMRRIVDLTTDIVAHVADTDARPTYVENKKQESITDTSDGASERPYFGSIPDFASEAEGVALSGVAPEGPAAKAGLKGGDVIIGFGESKISGIEDFQSALMKYKPGDKVKVKFTRGQETLESEVILRKR